MQVALFHSHDPAMVSYIASTMVGAASIGAPSPVTGQAVDIILKLFAPSARDRCGLPHRLLVSVYNNDVLIHASNRHGVLRPQVARYTRGQFRADLNRYPEDVELTRFQGPGPEGC